MTRDARLEGPAFRKLVSILTAAVRDETKIRTFARTLNIEGQVDWGGDAKDQWTALVDIAGDRTDAFDELLDAIDEHLKSTRYYGEFMEWRGQGAESGRSAHGKLDAAVSDVRKSRNSLLMINDPRKGQLYLRAMRSSIMEIKEIIETVPDKAPDDSLGLAAGAEEVAAARSEILFACEGALREVDQLTIDIAEAKRQSARVRQEYSGQEAFTAERSMVRHLLHDRGLVDYESQGLLEVIGQQLIHLRIPVKGPDLQGQSVPSQPQRAEP